MKVSDVLQWIDEQAPFATACSFDNVGLLVGDETAEVCTIGLALDATNLLVERAKTLGVDLLITHHPVIFDPLRRVTANTPVYRMVQAGISCIAAHTNLDKAPGGTNDAAAEAMGLFDITTPESFESLGRLGLVDEQPVALLAKRLKEASHASAVRFYDAGHAARRVAVAAGSGGSMLEAAIEAGADTLVTGDIKHDRFVEAENRGINLVEWNHYDAEHLVLFGLKERLEAAFSVPVVLLREDNILQSV
jgi:dinuclear metal center YbgI/SA1388 family protein